MRAATLTLALACGLSIPASAQVLSGFGTAVIDGLIDNQEWASAAAPLFQANVPGGGTTSAGFFVMNDATNLYLALVVVYLDDEVDFSVSFDANGDGDTLTVDDDDIGCFSAGDAPRDGYRTESSAPSDASGGGTLDVLCASSTTASSTYVEMSHPLDSGDGRDIAVGPGALLPFFAGIRLFPGSVDSFYPGPAAGIEAQIEIAPEPGGGAMAATALGVLGLRARRRCAA